MSTLSQKEEYTVPSAYHHIQDALGVLIGEGAERIVENCAHPT